MKIDALRIVVEVPTYEGRDGVYRERYASTNSISDHGQYHGAKSEEYLDLFRRVREAARAEIAATGWSTWPYDCEVSVTRYHRTLRRPDSSNLGKVEVDALAPSVPHEERRDRCEPFLGVYMNDRQARPYHATTEYDPEGPDRVLIVVRRRYMDPAQAPRSTESTEKRQATGASPRPKVKTPRAIAAADEANTAADERTATLGGQPISREAGLRYIHASDAHGRGRRR
jgi:hypothetical protein